MERPANLTPGRANPRTSSCVPATFGATLSAASDRLTPLVDQAQPSAHSESKPAEPAANGLDGVLRRRHRRRRRTQPRSLSRNPPFRTGTPTWAASERLLRCAADFPGARRLNCASVANSSWKYTGLDQTPPRPCRFSPRRRFPSSLVALVLVRGGFSSPLPRTTSQTLPWPPMNYAMMMNASWGPAIAADYKTRRNMVAIGGLINTRLFTCSGPDDL